MSRRILATTGPVSVNPANLWGILTWEEDGSQARMSMEDLILYVAGCGMAPGERTPHGQPFWTSVRRPYSHPSLDRSARHLT